MSEAVQSTGPVILFIDDSPVDRALIQRMLPKYNFQVIVAENGERGISMAEEKQPNLILLDIILPRISGVEICKKLKSNPKTKAIPIIFFSSMEVPREFLNFAEVGAVDLLSKSQKSDAIVERINKALGLSKA